MSCMVTQSFSDVHPRGPTGHIILFLILWVLYVSVYPGIGSNIVLFLEMKAGRFIYPEIELEEGINGLF